jgi:pimeloyl-ACP methyl ester carboxylesterase
VQSTLDIHGVRTPVIDEGEGRTLLLVHGVPDSGAVWRPLMDRLGPGFRFIAPDLHGLGRGHAPREFSLSLENRAAWLEDLLDALEVDGPVDLVCHDFGGPTSLAWAVRNPDRVRSMTLMATCFHREWRWHSLGRGYRTPLLGELMMAFQNAPWLGYRLFVKEMRKGSADLDEAFLRECYANARAGDPRFIIRMYRETPPEIFEGWDTQLYALVEQRPTLCLWSDRDPYVPLEFAEHLVDLGAELHRFADVGHWMMIEATDRVADHVHGFLGAQARA